MIINSEVYGGACSCGRSHEMETRLAVVEAGCLAQLDHWLEQYHLGGFRTVIYDENTCRAEGVIRPAAHCEIVLDPKGLHADEHGVAQVMDRLPEETEVLIAIGSGTVHDITRYCAYLRKIPFVSCPTAASVDGFCSSVAAMTWEGAKKTLTAVAPTLVLADTNVISRAPLYLARSGFGDMIGKYIALADWRMAHALTGEFYCERIAAIMEEATRAVLDSAAGIAAGEGEAYEKLIGGLLLSGIAMQMMGNSRPASGGEHHISHCIEMGPDGLGIRSDALHGEKVGVGTLLAAEEYHRLAALPDEVWGDYPGFAPEAVEAVFGPRLSRQIFEENKSDCAAGITGAQIRAHLDAIRREVGKIPAPETLLAAYRTIGAMETTEEIGVSSAHISALLENSPMVRNRLTLMRLRHCLTKK